MDKKDPNRDRGAAADQGTFGAAYGAHLRRLHAAGCMVMAEFDDHGRCIECERLKDRGRKRPRVA